MPKLYGTPGPRAIWPSVARNRQLAACSLGARLLFDRLISQADDQGRLEGDPILVRAACMPLDAEATLPAIRKWLTELENAGRDPATDPDSLGLIVRYEAHGQALIQLSNWWTYQAGQKRIYASRWPAPDGWPDDRIKNTDDPREGRHGRKGEGQPSDGAGDRAEDGASDGAGDAPETGRGTPRNPSPRARDSVPLPVPDSESPPNPPRGGRRPRERDLGPYRQPSGTYAAVGDDEPWR